MTDIPMHGGLVVGPYKGYHGRAEYDPEAKLFHGEVTETRDVITFVGREPAEIHDSFKDSIDDYLAFCKSRGEAPDKPFSGRFLVRTTPKLHHGVSILAAEAGKSLNQYVVDILESAANIGLPGAGVIAVWGTSEMIPIASLGSTQKFTVDVSSVIGGWELPAIKQLGAASTTPRDPKPVSLPAGGRLRDLPIKWPAVTKTGANG